MTRCLRWAEVAKAAWVPYQADTAGLEAKAERMEAWRVPFLAGMAGAKAGMVVVVAAAAAAMDTRHKCPYNTCACKQGCLCSPMPSQGSLIPPHTTLDCCMRCLDRRSLRTPTPPVPAALAQLLVPSARKVP